MIKDGGDMAKYNWEELEREYILNDYNSVSEFLKIKNIPRNGNANKKTAKWNEKKAKKEQIKSEKVKEKVIEQESTIEANNRIKINDVADKLLKQIANHSNKIENDRKIKTLTSALKDHKMMYTDEEYQALQLKYINQITCQQRTIKEEYVDDTLVYEEGIVLDEQVAIKDVLQEYNSKVTDLNSFVEFMFKYSTDTATLNADMPYVIGYNTITDETYTTTVESFTNEAVRLMKSNQKYTMANEYIISSYGVHLLYYVAPLVNQIEYSSLSNVTVQQLDSAILNPATGETYLDRIFDLVYPASSSGMFSSNTKYSDFETILIESLYSKYQVVLYETKIKASNKI